MNGDVFVTSFTGNYQRQCEEQERKQNEDQVDSTQPRILRIVLCLQAQRNTLHLQAKLAGRSQEFKTGKEDKFSIGWTSRLTVTSWWSHKKQDNLWCLGTSLRMISSTCCLLHYLITLDGIGCGRHECWLYNALCWLCSPSTILASGSLSFFWRNCPQANVYAARLSVLF